MLRIQRLLICALVLGAGSLACGDGRRTGERQEAATQAPADFGPMAVYERRFLFLGPGQRLPTAAVVDFVALSDSIGLRRGVRARLVDGAGWTRLMDDGWEMDRMRDPWRLVPYGPLRLLVGDDGELNALVFRHDAEVRLEQGGALAGYTHDPGTQLVLRDARLAIGPDLVHGILLDAQLGRALDPAASREDATLGDAGDDDDGHATPAARAGAEALLIDAAGYHLVFVASAAGHVAWIHRGGTDDVRRGARLSAVGWQPGESGIQVANAWQVVGPGGLAGELVAEAVDGIEISGPGEIESLGYAVVSGWIEDRGGRRDVFGLVRHVR